MANTYLTFTQQSPSTAEAQKFTLSMWVKKCANGTGQGLYGNTYSNTHRGYIYFDTTDRLAFFDSSGTNIVLSKVFRDTNAWYHIVFAVDTTQSSDADKIKIYINGELYAGSYSSNTYPNNNQDLKIMNTTNTPYMGRYVEAGTSYYLQGVLSHVHFTQGYVYQASDFGETDSATGEWKIKVDPSISNYGTNGFWWLKDNIATTDHSPNSNTFTVGGGTLTKTEDSPSSIFATLNPLDVHPSASTTFANGATTITTNSSGSRSTLGNATGKFYAEAKISANTAWIGVQDADSLLTTNDNATMLYPAGASMYVNGSNQGSGGYGSAWSANDIMMIAMDLDSTQKKVYFGKNGGWWNGSDYTANSPTTGENLSNNTTYVFRSDSGSGSQTAYWNFGNGYFGTTAVSSAGTNASNIGIFEYNVPTGYTALSTKGLNE